MKEDTDDGLAGDGYLRHHRRLVGNDAGSLAPAEAGEQGMKGWLAFSRKSARDHLAQGTQQAMMGEYAKALKSLTKALKQDPNLTEAYLHRGIAYLEMGRVDEALQDLNRAVARMPREPLAYYNRALAWVALGDWARAEADLERAVTLAPEDAASWNWLAIVRSQQGKVEEALEAIERAIVLGDPAGERNRAIILEKAGRVEEALAAWSRYAAQGRAAEAYARARRGLLLWRLGREKEAQDDLAWTWKRRRRLDSTVRAQLQEVRREMRCRMRPQE